MVDKKGLQIGSLVVHIKLGWIGTVAGFHKRNCGVLVNLSDKYGVRFRWIHIDNLRILNPKGGVKKIVWVDSKEEKIADIIISWHNYYIGGEAVISIFPCYSSKEYKYNGYLNGSFVSGSSHST